MFSFVFARWRNKSKDIHDLVKNTQWISGSASSHNIQFFLMIIVNCLIQDPVLMNKRDQVKQNSQIKLKWGL